jgi:hypothetical protein
MKLCLDVKDKYESVFNKLSEKQKERLIKGLSAHANAILATLENTDNETLDSMLKVLTSAMFLLGEITGNEIDDNDEEEG